MSLSGSYFQNYKNLDIHSEFPAENIDRYPIFNFTVHFKKEDLYVIRLFYSYSTEQTYSCLSTSNYEYYRNKNDNQFEFGIGSMFRLFPFAKGYMAAVYLQNKYLYKGYIIVLYTYDSYFKIV